MAVEVLGYIRMIVHQNRRRDENVAADLVPEFKVNSEKVRRSLSFHYFRRCVIGDAVVELCNWKILMNVICKS